MLGTILSFKKELGYGMILCGSGRYIFYPKPDDEFFEGENVEFQVDSTIGNSLKNHVIDVKKVGE